MREWLCGLRSIIIRNKIIEELKYFEIIEKVINFIKIILRIKFLGSSTGRAAGC